MIITDLQKNQIYALKSQGKTYVEIEALTGISAEAARSLIRRHPNPEDTGRCKYCGKMLPKIFTPRKRKFCSIRCKGLFYNKYGAGKPRVCRGCGREFRVHYKHPEKVYCCTECYHRFRHRYGKENDIKVQNLNGGSK